MFEIVFFQNMSTASGGFRPWTTLGGYNLPEPLILPLLDNNYQLWSSGRFTSSSTHSMSAFTLHPVVLPSAIAVLRHEETIASSLYERSMHWRHSVGILTPSSLSRKGTEGERQEIRKRKARKKDKSGHKINKKREIG